MEEARKYNVLPLDDRRVERFNSDIAGRPTLITGKFAAALRRHGRVCSENVVINIKNKSHSVTAELDVPEGGAEGVIVAQGGAFAGWSLYVEERQAEVLLQPLRPPALPRRKRERVPAGAHQVRMEFAYDGGGLGKGGTVSLYIDGTKTGEGRVEGTVPDALLGRRDLRRGLRHGLAGQRRLHPEGSRFTGTVEWVQIDIADAAEDLDHLITPEERLKIAMARQSGPIRPTINERLAFPGG